MKKPTYTCAEKMKERIHVCIPTGLREDIDAVCGGSLPPKELPHCKACVMGMKYEPMRFKELGHEVETEEHPFKGMPRQSVKSPLQKGDLGSAHN